MNKTTRKPRKAGDAWTDREDDVICRCWPTMGRGCAPELRAIAPVHRTDRAIQNRAHLLGVRDERRNRPRAEPPVKLVSVVVRRLADDEPLIVEKENRRGVRSSFGYIPDGPVASVFHLGARNE